MNMQKKKTFILDTNVLIHDPDSLYDFTDNIVVLPLVVIEELDNLKRHADDRGRNARLVTRRLDGLRKKGKISEGIVLENGGIIRIETKVKAELPEGLSKKADNEILSVALGLKEKGETVIFISKDMNLRVKAEVLGLEVQDFEKAKVSIDELYTGWRKLKIADKLIDEFISQKKMPATENDLQPNEFILLISEDNEKKTALARYVHSEKLFIGLKYEKTNPWGLKALNIEQQFAIEALLNKDIKLVSLVGIAGTGKTLLALACGLHLTFDRHLYRRVLISRPVIPLGKDIGYLPGTKDEKLSNWMGAFYDNLEFLIDTAGDAARNIVNGKGLKLPEVVDNLFETGKIEIEALAFLRGRSIPSQYMIVDEAQNLTPLEIKTIVSRAGSGTKVILAGDPYQIDNPYLDSSSNGLNYVVERFKSQDIFAHITLAKGERSKLAGLAAELL